MTQPTSTHANLGTLIQRLLEYVGQALNGLGTLNEISFSQKLPTTAIIHIDLCVRNSDMEAIMEASPIPSLDKPNSPSMLYRTSNPNISKHFLPIYRGRSGWTISSAAMDSLLHSLGVSDGFSEGEMIQLSFEKLSLMTPKAPSPT